MEVCFNHGDARWASHTAFMAFRRRLAKVLGFELLEMRGFGGRSPWSVVRDDLRPLLEMPDVVGSVRVKDCERVARRLRELAERFAEDDPDRARSLALADGLDAARAVPERFRFRR